ncbi:MAG: polysaccharide deacetylase family protein [Bdellovibrionaceae bacterium]|nr:polysaccharide deacetylase family protein [Pseudobdellovibrionaceae bacterium]
MIKFNKSLVISFSIYALALLVFTGCAKSAEEDLDKAVQTHIKAKDSTEAEDACRKVFLNAQKNADSGQLCKALKDRSDGEISICEDEIQDTKFTGLISPCKATLLARIEQIKKNRNEGLTEVPEDLNFKIPFAVQYRDLGVGYTAVTGDTQTKEVILSFDDGPHPTLSKIVVDMLDRIGAKAHFMQVGQNVQNNPSITKYISTHGHSIGNHSWDHTDFKTLSFDQQLKQISDTNKIIINTIGWIDPFFRYPYGSTTTDMNFFLKAHSEANFLWSIDSNDWRKINADESIRTNAQVVKETLDQLDQRGRGLVLFHDVHTRTIELLPTFLTALYKNGYKIVLLQAGDSGLKNNSQIP